MKAIEFHTDRTAAVVDVDRPSAGPADVVVRVAASGICGSDLTALLGRHPFRIPPLISGHEAGGTIAEVGRDVTSWAVGDRVAIEPQVSCGSCAMCEAQFSYLCTRKVMLGVSEWPGSFAEYVAVPATTLHRIEPAVDDELCALVEPMAVAVHSARQADALAGSRVAVLGGGTIGALIAHQCVAEGARRVVITDPRERCREIGRRVGAEPFAPGSDEWEAIASDTSQLSDYVFVATAVPGILDQAVALAKPRGTVVQVGLFGQPELFTVPALQMAERRIVGSNVYNWDDFEKAAAEIQRDPETVRAVITDRGSLHDAASYLNGRALGFEDDVVKFIMMPHQVTRDGAKRA